MTEEQGLAFLMALRVKNIRVKDTGWIEGSCPLAQWTHKHRHDSRPSFGLKIVPGERSVYHCFACRHGSVEELLQSIEFYSKGTGDYNFLLCHQLLDDEQFVVPLPEYAEFAHADAPFEEWPQYWLDSFSPVAWAVPAMAYLERREVGPEIAEAFDLRYDTKRQMIVAPYRDVHQRLAGARGRSILPDATQKHFDYTFQGVNNARLVWYNEVALNLPGPVVACEGQFDVFRIAQVFPKVVAALTAKPSWEKMKKLGDCSMVIQIPDRDETGRQSTQTYARYCWELGIAHHVLWLDEGVNDPAECHPEYLREKIHAAINCP